MTGDPELDGWRRQWQARDAVPADLRGRVEGEIRAARYALVTPLAITVLIGGGTLVWAIVSPDRDAYVLATATWVFITITWITSLMLTRRIGQGRAPDGESITAFLDFTIKTCRGKRAAITAAAVLYPIFLVFMLVWRYQTAPFARVSEYVLSGPVLLILGITIVLAILGLLTHRGLGAELDRLRAMRARFADGGDLPKG